MTRTPKSAADSFNEIATIRIELCDTGPLIWREVEVPTSMTLTGLHDVIQAVMGWFDCHLWEFTIAKQRYGLPDDMDWGTAPRALAAKVRLRDVLKPRRTTIDYLYDFGDSWGHRLTVTKIRPGDPGMSYPRYVSGGMNAPQKIAVAFRDSMTCSIFLPILKTKTMKKSEIGWTDMIPWQSTRN